MRSNAIPEWAAKVAERLGEGPHVVVSGISTSGHIHAGNLREVLVAEAVANALRARGEEVRFVFHADTIDPLRKIAPGIPKSFERYMGHSLSRIPDPEGCHDSYAEHFLAPFERALGEMGMEVEVLRSHELYESGVYTEVTREAIEHTEELRRIMQEVTGREMPEGWSPYLPRAASGDLTGNRVLEHLPGESKVRFVDREGREGLADYSRGEGKLGWRVELAARWKALGVTFEPFGKDHTSRGGSTDTADRMAREVFRYPVPGRYQYEWIGLKGRGDMSSSRGIVVLPEDLLEIMPPDALRRMVLGRDPSRRADLDLEGGFPRFMDEYRAGAGEDPVPFSHLAIVAQTVGDDVELASEMLRRGGYGRAARDRERLARELRYARNWAERWAPESVRFRLLSEEESRVRFEGLDEDQRGYLIALAAKLEEDMGPEEIQDALYETAHERGINSRRAFAALYSVLLGKKSGPKAGPFIAALSVRAVRERLEAGARSL
ncbi:Lysine--tRNA ligase [Rubrobacter xylanophilus DSM 9941]|uniref:lysine--tRNA ligase n=1 Tax=Rubrobacter xylanophilus TaxID=49319 RepID=UPI001C640004|nr:lysine--tRNA ligase [Rubrobacter xylanophilus]QYJ15339.1 Lysine--tRNA ligase [Rubrobacter xylanophilus DSM 9941]